MTAQTITQTQTLADTETDWTDTIGFQQFDPSLGSLLALDAGVTADVAGAVSIENLGPIPITSDISLLGWVSVIGPGSTSLVAASPQVDAAATLAPYDGTVDFAGASGTVLAGLRNTATNFSTHAISPGPGPFTGTGTVPVTVTAQASVTESGPANLEMLANTSAGAVVTLQYDFTTTSSDGAGSSSVVYISPSFPISPTIGSLPSPNQVVASAIQTFVVPDTVTDWAGTVAAEQFDPALGTLKAVSFQLIGELDSSFGIENLGTAASDFDINQAAFVSLVVPGTTEVVSASPDSVSSVLGGFDGSNDFAGPSGQTLSDMISTGTIVDNLTNALDLDAFAGSGTIDLGVSSHGTADAMVPGNSLLKLDGLAGATIELSYLYLPTAATDDQGGIPLSAFGPDALPVVGTPEFSTVSVDPACFARATRIATKHGERAVETLAVGDRVLLARGGSAPIIWVGRRKVDCRRHPDPTKVQPVRIKAHAFGRGVPARDLLLSPDHAIYAEGVLIPVKCLVNGTTVMQESVDSIEYWHLELARHDLLLAENLAAESLLDTGNKAAFENGGTSVQLYPDFAPLRWEGAGCAPLKVVGPEVDRTRARLSRTGMKAAAANRTARAV